MNVKTTLIINQNEKELLDDLRRELNLKNHQKKNFIERKI